MASVVPLQRGPPPPPPSPPPSSPKRHGLRRFRSTVSVREDTMIVDLGPTHFAVVWLVLLLVHSVCVVYFVGAAIVLVVVDLPFMVYYAELLRPGLKPLLRPAAICYGLVSVAHALQFTLMVVASCRIGHLSVVWPRGCPPCYKQPTDSSSFSSLLQKQKKQWLPHAVSLFFAVFQDAWRALFSRRGLFGVNSPYYHWRYVVRETIEIVSQSIQAYSSSVLIAKPWVNNLYIAIVVLNCWSTPLIQRIAHRQSWSPAAERLTCVVVDTLLDSGTAMVLPVLLVLPYASAIDFTVHSFDLDLLYDDVWYIQLINDNRQIIPLGFADFFLKFVPHISIFLALGSIKSIVRCRRPRRKPRTEAGIQAESPRKRKLLDAATMGSKRKSIVARLHEHLGRRRTHNTNESRNQPPHPGIEPRIRRLLQLEPSPRAVTMLHTCFALLGVVLLFLHLRVVVKSYTTDLKMSDRHGACKQLLRPWFVQKSACAIYEYNCHRHETKSMESDALASLDTSSLVVLIISHCPALVVPSEIQLFPNLLGMEIYNSTISHWGLDAALTSRTHPSITYAFLILTQLGEIPPALLHGDLPPTLIDIEISHTNLSRIPEHVDKYWGHLLTLYVEYSLLTELPLALTKLALDDFSVIGNQITSLPEFSSSFDGCFMMAFAVNPIVHLPASLGRLEGVSFFNFVATQLTELPHAMVGASASVYVAETPFCQSKSSDEVTRSYSGDALISCVFLDRRIKSQYPLEVVTRLRIP